MNTLPSTSRAPDPKKLDAFVERILGDLGAAMAVPLVRIGDELGLYAAMDGAGPLTPSELAQRAGTNERLLREWLSAHAAAGYLDYDPVSGRFAMTPEQAMVFARADSPVLMLGAFEIAAANVVDQPKVVRAFREDRGQGAGYDRRCSCLFSGMARFFRPGYAAHLLQEWLPALDGVEERLRRGARVADLGCGHGEAVIMMAEAFPASFFIGFDDHAPSIASARDAAARRGVAGNTAFEVSRATEFSPQNYDLITCFDALHDMGDPVAVATQVRRALRPDGTFMVVEPKAGDRLEDNLNPIGRLYYAGSTMVCTPVSLDQPGAAALGAQAGPSRLIAVLNEARFSHVRVASTTPFNIMLEAKS
jgi:2-polyprenyl-3-methyl-5-hydroxy-6-metoxy-1,4-benzoquinol methylase